MRWAAFVLAVMVAVGVEAGASRDFEDADSDFIDLGNASFNRPGFTQLKLEFLVLAAVQIRNKVWPRGTGYIDDATTRSQQKFSKGVIDTSWAKVVCVDRLFRGVAPSNLCANQ